MYCFYTKNILDGDKVRNSDNKLTVIVARQKYKLNEDLIYSVVKNAQGELLLVYKNKLSDGPGQYLKVKDLAEAEIILALVSKYSTKVAMSDRTEKMDELTTTFKKTVNESIKANALFQLIISAEKNKVDLKKAEAYLGVLAKSEKIIQVLSNNPQNSFTFTTIKAIKDIFTIFGKEKEFGNIFTINKNTSTLKPEVISIYKYLIKTYKRTALSESEYLKLQDDLENNLSKATEDKKAQSLKSMLGLLELMNKNNNTYSLPIFITMFFEKDLNSFKSFVKYATTEYKNRQNILSARIIQDNKALAQEFNKKKTFDLTLQNLATAVLLIDDQKSFIIGTAQGEPYLSIDPQALLAFGNKKGNAEVFILNFIADNCTLPNAKKLNFATSKSKTRLLPLKHIINNNIYEKNTDQDLLKLLANIEELYNTSGKTDQRNYLNTIMKQYEAKLMDKYRQYYGVSYSTTDNYQHMFFTFSPSAVTGNIPEFIKDFPSNGTDKELKDAQALQNQLLALYTAGNYYNSYLIHSILAAKRRSQELHESKRMDIRTVRLNGLAIDPPQNVAPQ